MKIVRFFLNKWLKNNIVNNSVLINRQLMLHKTTKNVKFSFYLFDMKINCVHSHYFAKKMAFIYSFLSFFEDVLLVRYVRQVIVLLFSHHRIPWRLLPSSIWFLSTSAPWLSSSSWTPSWSSIPLSSMWIPALLVIIIINQYDSLYNAIA